MNARHKVKLRKNPMALREARRLPKLYLKNRKLNTAVAEIILNFAQNGFLMDSSRWGSGAGLWASV